MQEADEASVQLNQHLYVQPHTQRSGGMRAEVMEFILNGSGSQLERGICCYIVWKADLCRFVMFVWVVGVLPGQEVK